MTAPDPRPLETAVLDPVDAATSDEARAESPEETAPAAETRTA